jgi:alpha-amylase/alpha-mannosidase (GH57 family)
MSIAIARKPLKLSLIFHMHQPSYQDPVTGRYLMPYVMLHGIKDYLGMARLSQKYPRVKTTFNYVPSLLEQALDYAQNPVKDHYRCLAKKDPKDLTHEEKAFIIKNFLVKNKLAEESLRYIELFNNVAAGRPLSDGDFCDLQVLSFFIWFPKQIIEEDPALWALYKKGKDFNAQDKQVLFARIDHYMKEIIPALKALQERGTIELTTSPFYHPILPLLHSSAFAKVKMPGSKMPKRKFRRPEDVIYQIDSAVRFHEKVFGKKPEGMWPSEGSVSSRIIPPTDEAGIRWIASGQHNLVNSLHYSRGRPYWPLAGHELYSPWRAVNGKHRAFMVFRDDGLSDLIGFHYSKYTYGSDAVNNLFGHLRNIKADLERNPGSLGDRPGLVSLILDGENAWEYYPGNGRYFLEELYSRLSREEDGIETTTVTEYLDEYGCPEENVLSKLSPGSWIGGDFATWIGSPGSNKAWQWLIETREAIGKAGARAPRKAWECMYRAESSDWMWWYGGRNATEQYPIFDHLFRSNLIMVHTLCGSDPPADLYNPIEPS